MALSSQLPDGQTTDLVRPVRQHKAQYKYNKGTVCYYLLAIRCELGHPRVTWVLLAPAEYW